MTLVMLAMTSGLGFWQLRRLAWKQGLLAELARGEQMAPVPRGEAPLPFRRVWVEGVFAPLTARYGAEVRNIEAGPVMGAHVIGALLSGTGLPILVDEGWAPLDFAATPREGKVRIEGFVRPPDRSLWLGPKDDLVERRFFALDPAVIGPSLGFDKVAPFTVVALGRSMSPPFPDTALPRPSNDHLSYAITWFGLALSLMVVFGIYVRQVVREASQS